MSTVLWANYLSEGSVVSDESDKYALYKHMDKLDDLAASNKLLAFSSLCDSTDIEFNLADDAELPPGMESTNEVMAQKGVWVEAKDAVHLFESLLSVIKAKKTRFGLLKNDHDAVLEELAESLAFAKTAAEKAAKFNFAIVM
jgi:hypothetical protein